MPSNKCKPLPAMSNADIERFYEKIIHLTPTDCWPWKGSRNKQGYGMFSIGQQTIYSSRVSYFLAKGTDPYPDLIRHTCDNPPCCNPGHLIPGTHTDNYRDSVERFRRLPGEGNPNAILTEEQVKGVLADREAGMTIFAICDKYGVTQGSINAIIYGWTWKHISGPRKAPKKQLTPELVREIRRRRSEGAILKALASEYSMSLGAIHALVTRQTWPEVD